MRRNGEKTGVRKEFIRIDQKKKKFVKFDLDCVNEIYSWNYFEVYTYFSMQLNCNILWPCASSEVIRLAIIRLILLDDLAHISKHKYIMFFFHPKHVIRRIFSKSKYNTKIHTFTPYNDHDRKTFSVYLLNALHILFAIQYSIYVVVNVFSFDCGFTAELIYRLYWNFTQCCTSMWLSAVHSHKLVKKMYSKSFRFLFE